jgi:hypothetical protein
VTSRDVSQRRMSPEAIKLLDCETLQRSDESKARAVHR